MRRFHSYGPVDSQEHFCVVREALVEQCVSQLIGHPEKGGHYFTIWAPRQTGKTWLMRQAQQQIRLRNPEQFTVFNFSLGNLRGMKYALPEEPGSPDLPQAFQGLLRANFPGSPDVTSWEAFDELFFKENGLWEKPLILLIDEVDSAPAVFLDLLAGRFREMFLNRERYGVHSMALAGVRAVLGIESRRGSPFNIQRSLHVPNLTREEVQDLYRQYQEESGQQIESAVIDAVYECTQGQPGLVSWFGELLTETYNPGQEQILDDHVWQEVYESACYSEFNTTVLNLIKKAQSTYSRHVLDLFANADVRFSLDADWCGYLYMNGIIDQEKIVTESGERITVCRFASPFIQLRLFNALTYHVIDEKLPLLALEPLDDLADVFAGGGLVLPALLRRYQDYLARLKARGMNPWKDQPRRVDVQYTEAVGHFHLYAWLRDAVSEHCIVSPEFPTGNGKVDLHLKCGQKQGIIEVKSFSSALKTQKARMQAAHYAKSLGLAEVTLAMFTPVEDDAILEKLSGVESIDGIRVMTVAIKWT